MSPAFEKVEYENRIKRLRHTMTTRGLEVLVIGDPSNINWLTGYDAWSFYTPQMVVLDLHYGPYWLGRAMDAGAAKFTSYLTEDQVIGYPESLVQTNENHPADFISNWMKNMGYSKTIIGYENDSYFTSSRSLNALKEGLPNANWINTDLIVNWERVVKSEAELSMMRQAGKIAEIAMKTAFDQTRVGVKQSELMANVVAAQIKGTKDYGGDMTALHPLILAGEAASTAHPMWNDDELKAGQTIAFELGGCRKRYNVGLARTVHLGGKPPSALLDTAKAVNEGMSKVMNCLKADVTAGEVHLAWQKVLDKFGLKKESRIGYSIGVGYPPDWGEHTISFRKNETTIVPHNAVVHIILGMWMDGWGMELSETLHVRKKDCISLADFSWNVHFIS